MILSTVIIAFYYKINFLELVLAGYEQQTVKDFQIIIADDGSPDNIVKKVEKIINNSPLSITFISQKKKGFGKNRIFNKAIAKAKGKHLIFSDGDCIPHKSFVEEHFKT